MAPNKSDLAESARPVAHQPTRFKFSTDLIPERDRIGFFQEELAKVLSVEIALLDDAAPKYVIDTIIAGPVAVNAVTGTPTRVSRTKAHSDEDDSFLLMLQTGGHQEISHNGSAVRLEPGDACLVYNSLTSTGALADGGSTISLHIEGSALRALVRQPEALAGARIDRHRPGVGLLRGYVRSLSEENDLAPGMPLRTFGLHTIDLVAAVLGATRDGAAQADAGGIRAARRKQVLDNIATRACDPAFNIETIAADLAVTSRTIQMMLEETGSTFTEHVSEERLRRAWRLLADPMSRLAIADVALEAGFNDLSHFYRAFRRRYGETPAAARASGRNLH